MPNTQPKDHLNPAEPVCPTSPADAAAARRGVVRALGRWGVAAVCGAPAVLALADERPAAGMFRIGGAGAAMGTMSSALAALAQRGLSATIRTVANLGSAGSLRAVEQGALDVALISRPLNVDERMRGLHAVEYGRTPFALATSMQGVSGVTRKRLAEMIEDPHATWPDGTPVRLVLRPKSDGDHVLLASLGALVELALERATTRPGMVIAITDQEAADAVARLRGGLGTCSLALLRSGAPSLVALAVDGVAPTVANVENASYRIVNRMHVATLGPPKGLALELLSYLQSPDGLVLLAQLGHSTRFRR